MSSKYIKDKIFRNWRVIGAVNLIFWPILGIAAMKFVLPKEKIGPNDVSEVDRIKKMLDDVYKKSAQEKMEDAWEKLSAIFKPKPHSKPEDASELTKVNAHSSTSSSEKSKSQ